jgi:TetR/AcrR family acrAB operon transcriptional repressor
MARRTKEEAQRTREAIIDAARAVFLQHGVARSTLEQVATAAGLTRGAVYWHFKDKAELFNAMRADVFEPLHERLDAKLFSEQFADPLDAIESSIREFFLVLDECPTVRQMCQIMTFRCEHVDEFAGVQKEAERPGAEFLEKLKKVYARSAARGTLRPGLDPEAAALDTWAFTGGLHHALLAHGADPTLRSQVVPMIAAHMALRRR